MSGYIPTSSLTPVLSGIGEFDASVLGRPGYSREEVLFNLFTSTWGFLVDREQVSAFNTSFNCHDCFSIVLPGRFDKIVPSPGKGRIRPFDEENGGELYVVDNAPGYYFELNTGTFNGEKEVFLSQECRVYPVGTAALAICAKNVDDAIIYGINFPNK